MKKINILLSFIFLVAILLGISILSRGKQRKPSNYFLEKYRLPNKQLEQAANALFSKKEIQDAFDKKDIKKIKEAGFICFSTWGNLIVEHPTLPGWIIKGGSRFFASDNNIKRIKNAKKINNCIEKFHLKNVVVPKKYIFHIPGKSYELINKNYLIFSEKLDIDESASLSSLPKSKINEILLVIRKVGLCDAKGSNIKILKNGKIAVVDTEPFFEFNFRWWKFLESTFLTSIKGAIGAIIFQAGLIN